MNLSVEMGDRKKLLQLCIAGIVAFFGIADGLFATALFVQQNISLFVGAVVIAAVIITLVRFIHTRLPWIILTSIALILLIVLGILWLRLSSSNTQPVQITITNPQNSGSVTHSYTVSGQVSDPNAQVYVVVHSIKEPDLWVQNQPIVAPDGSWQISALFGTPTLGIGEDFEIVALATNENFLLNWAKGNTLSTGQVLTELPERINKSNIITVKRLE